MALNRSPELVKFVAAAKEKGASDETLVGILENAGWPRAEIWEVLGEQYESLTGVQIPPGRKTQTPAKDAFLYLLAFSTLATWTISLGSICYALIDDWIRDPLGPGTHRASRIKSPASSPRSSLLFRCTYL